MILDGKTLRELREFRAPDGAETYCAPAVVELSDTTWVLWGTGGETLPGQLYSIPLGAFWDGTAQQVFQTWVSGGTKGIMQPPVFVDITHDGTLDVIVSIFEGGLLALDGRSHAELWRVNISGTENYTQPSIGRFVGDSTLDFFFQAGFGTFDTSYDPVYRVVVDGHTGLFSILDSVGSFEIASAVAVDLNGDDRDEVLWLSWQYACDTTSLLFSHNILLA